MVSVLDLDNTFFSGGIHEEDRGNSLGSCLPILKVLIARKLMITRLEPHRDPSPNADGSNSVDIVSLFTMSIRLRTDDQTHGVCLMMCPIVYVCWPILVNGVLPLIASNQLPQPTSRNVGGSRRT